MQNTKKEKTEKESEIKKSAGMRKRERKNKGERKDKKKCEVRKKGRKVKGWDWGRGKRFENSEVRKKQTLDFSAVFADQLHF